MNVADFKTGTVTRETTGSERRQAAFVREFGERIDLVMNCDNWLRPKKSRITAESAFG